MRWQKRGSRMESAPRWMEETLIRALHSSIGIHTNNGQVRPEREILNILILKGLTIQSLQSPDTQISQKSQHSLCSSIQYAQSFYLLSNNPVANGLSDNLISSSSSGSLSDPLTQDISNEAPRFPWIEAANFIVDVWSMPDSGFWYIDLKSSIKWERMIALRL